VRPFVIFALPRSRTAWISRYLTYREWQCGHDEVRHCRSLDDVRAWLSQPCTGSVETGAAPFWRLLTALQPEVRVVTVRRPVADVMASLLRLGGPAFDATLLAAVLRRLDHKLDQIEARVPGTLRIEFDELATEDGCRRLWEHCLPQPFDATWHALLAPTNIQVNMGLVLRYFAAYRPQLDKLAQLARHRIIANMRPPERPVDGMTFQAEPFRSFCQDAAPLLREHCAITGRKPNLDFNVRLFEALDDVGALQTMTVRSNGRCFGYLLSIIGPSLEGDNAIHATHTAFYTSPDVRGIGVRLLMRAHDALRARGVHQVIMRAGVNGSGPSLGAVYRRLGAEPFGGLWQLNMGA